MSRPRIVIVSAFLTPFRSGAEACAEEVPAALSDLYEFIIVTARLQGSLPKHDTLESGVTVLRVGMGWPLDKWLFPFLAPLAIKKLRPTIVHAVLESYAGLALVFVSWLCPDMRRILTLQSTNTRLFLRQIHRAADRITGISTALIERARVLGFPRVTLIPNGIPLHELQAACARAHKMHGRVLYVGRLEPMKGVDTLLDAFALVARRIPHATLHIVGDGSERAHLEAMCRSLGLHDRVRFQGYLSGWRLYHEYAEAEVFAGLSRSEALGNVFLEAQAAGCAVIATRVGGIPDIVHEEVTGMLLQPDDPQAAGMLISQLLQAPEARMRLTTRAIPHAERYDWAVIATQYAEVYQAMLSRSGAVR